MVREEVRHDMADRTDRAKLADTTPRMAEGRSIDEALSEVERELNVRMKCFDRWVSEGRLSYIDAKDRLERLMRALQILETLEMQQRKTYYTEHRADNTGEVPA